VNNDDSNCPCVAVVDIGSNSIKLLVAGACEPVQVLHQAIRETRLAVGMATAQPPRLQETALQAGVESVASLLEEAQPFAPQQVRVVATSAVRDAANRDAFARRILEATGQRLEVLSGVEEARLIAKGISTDPAIRSCRNFSVVDLGGGSLECIRWCGGEVTAAVSLNLGAVRLAERFHPVIEEPLGEKAAFNIRATVQEAIRGSGFHFGHGEPLIGTGGSLNVGRLLLAEKLGRKVRETSPNVTVNQLQSLYADLAQMNLASRKAIPGMPPERADIYPTALVTLLAIAELAGAACFLHSFRNLRFGVVADAMKELRLHS